MIKRLIILLIFISCKASQKIETLNRSAPIVPYVVTWVCKNEEFVINYKLQKSRNNKNWTTIGEVIKPIFTQDSSVYNIALPKTSLSNYYRVTATMIKGSFNTLSIYLINTNSK